MSKEQSDIRIYVACLAAYNNAILHGRWIDACQDENDIRAEIEKMLKASPIEGAEEYAIHDYEGFEGAPLEEFSSIAYVAELAEFIAEYGRLGGELIAYYCDLDEAKTALEEHYAGEYASVSAFAENLTEETIQIPKSLQFYIDYERMARDLEINDIFSIETGFEQVHIFWRH